MTRFLQGDCLAVLLGLPAGSINCCVTSPPYYGLRDYGVAGQIGLESTPEAYVEKLVAVFREVWRVLKDDGTVWLVLGDSWNVKNLIGIPWRVAFALQADGWYLRQDIIWSKPNPMPESVKDRCTKSHEYIFLLSKSRKYYFDQEAIKEPVAEATVERNSYQYNMAFRGQFKGSPKDKKHQEGKYITAVGPASWKGSRFDTGKHQLDRAQKGDRVHGNLPGRSDGGAACNELGQERRNRRSVWTVSTKSFKEAHFATFPPDLIEPCILAGCPRDGTVLDPFSGAGTTGMVCLAHARNYIGIELNEEYVKMSTRRLRAARD
jgi:site-specific DNA-methyltransferase (adenine-specific)